MRIIQPAKIAFVTIIAARQAQNSNQFTPTLSPQNRANGLDPAGALRLAKGDSHLVLHPSSLKNIENTQSQRLSSPLISEGVANEKGIQSISAQKTASTLTKNDHQGIQGTLINRFVIKQAIIRNLAQNLNTSTETATKVFEGQIAGEAKWITREQAFKLLNVDSDRHTNMQLNKLILRSAFQGTNSKSTDYVPNHPIKEGDGFNVLNADGSLPQNHHGQAIWFGARS